MTRFGRAFGTAMAILSYATVQATVAAPRAGPTEDEAQVRNGLKHSAEAWNRHDAAAFAMAFAEDADFTNVRGMSAHGRAEIAKFHAPIFATMFKDSFLKIDNIKVRFIKPDVAAVDGWWEMTGATDQDGKEIPRRADC